MTPSPKDVVAFWRDEVRPARWYIADPTLDALIRERLGAAQARAAAGELADWEESAESALALLILLDQVPRNIFRGKAQAFATDAMARGVADRALARGYDDAAPQDMRVFFYLPFMHSEDLADQDRSVALVEQRLGKDSLNYPFAIGHRDIVKRFGRFPARNAALNRSSMKEELAYLAGTDGH